MTLNFPFEKLRENQDEMIQKVESSIREGKNLLIHAPTGTGKTISALYPAIKVASEFGLNVFFLTPRHSQHQIALDTLKKMGEKRTVDIIGKKWLCNQFYDGLSSSEFQDVCNYLKKEDRCEYYNKVYKRGEITEEAKLKLDELSSEILSAEELRKRCPDFCPFEISCHSARKSKVIVADYFHLFNPHISGTFLAKTGKNLEDSIIIIDEAHQLPVRAKDLVSSKLTTYVLNNAISEANEAGLELQFEIEKFRDRIEQLAFEKLSGKDEEYLLKEELVAIFNSLEVGFLDRLQALVEKIIESGKERSFSSGLLAFIEKWLDSDDNFVRIISQKESKYGQQIEVKLSALLPARITSDIINNSYSTILMSATLQPPEMYAEILGVKNYQISSFKSVFPRENRLNIIAPIATTRYSKRGDDQYENHAEIIEKVFEASSGNTAVFFPSYHFLEKVNEKLSFGIDKFVETQEVNKEKKRELLKKFIDSKKSLLLGVQSGSFDQGIDFPNNTLKCIVIAGIALATPNLETKSLIDCYNKNYRKGMEYGYIYPALQKVVQASGRAIRSEMDKAAIIYLDERFTWKTYRQVLLGEDYKISREPWREIRIWNKTNGYNT